MITGEGLPESVDNVLSALKIYGVRNIELRTVRAYHSASDVRRVAERLWDDEFHISLHGDVKTADCAVTELFTPIKELLASLRQNIESDVKRWLSQKNTAEKRIRELTAKLEQRKSDQQYGSLLDRKVGQNKGRHVT